MSYKKLLFGLLITTCFVYISDNNAGEGIAAAMRDGEEGMEGGALRGGGKDGEGLGGDTFVDPDAGLGLEVKGGGGDGLGAATTTADERTLGDEGVGGEELPTGGGASGESAPGAKGPGGNPTAGFDDLRLTRGPRGEVRVKGDGAPRDGASGQGEREPTAGEEPAAGPRKLTKEETDRINAEVDGMSDEALMGFKGKAGEDSAALTKAQDNFKLADKNFKESDAAFTEAKSDLKKAQDNVKATGDQLDEAMKDLKGFEGGKYFKKDENGKEGIDFAFAKKRNIEIKKRLDEMEKSGEGELDGETLSALKSEDESLSKFLKSSKAAKEAKVTLKDKQANFEDKQLSFNRAKMNLDAARDNLRSAIKGMSAARFAAASGSLSTTTTGAGRTGEGAEPSPEGQAANTAAADAERQAKMEAFDKQIKEKDDDIEFLQFKKDANKEFLGKARNELSELEGKRSQALSNSNAGEASRLEKEIDKKKQEIGNLERGSFDLDKQMKSAEKERTGLVEKRDALGSAEDEAGAKAQKQRGAFLEDLGKMKKKIFGLSKEEKEKALEKPRKEMEELKAKRVEAEAAGDTGEVERLDQAIKEKQAEIDQIELGKVARFRKYWKGATKKEIAADAGNATYTGVKKGVTWGLQKAKKFGSFLWEQMKIGFAFMIPGDIVATIQAAYQAKAMYKMITSMQNFAGINMYTIEGLIPRSDATNGIFLYTDTEDSSQYTDPNRRFFMSYSNYGDLGTNWLGSGAVSQMIEFSTGFLSDNNGDPIVYGFPGVPLRNVPGFSYSGTSGSNNTITTVIYEILPTVKRDVSGGVKREVKVDGMLEGFSKVNSTPSGNATIGALLATPRKSLPILFNSSLAAFQQGIASPKFGMSFRQMEGLGIVAYLLTHYQKVFEAESKGQLIDTDSVEMQLIAKLSEGLSIADLTTLATSDTYKLNQESFEGVSPSIQLLLGNVFVYQTDDTPIVGMMRNALPVGLKSHVHDYVVGINSANAVVPILVPAVNIPAGASVAVAPVVSWIVNPNVAYVVSLVSGATYCPGSVVLLNNGVADYTLGNTIWGQVIATSGNSTAYGAIAGFNNQLNALQQLAQFVIDKGPFNLNGRYKAYRVEGLEDMYTSQGLTDSQLQQAQSALLLGMAANESGAKLASADPIAIKDKKSAVQNGIFIYRIDKALVNGTLPDYVLPVMVNSSGNYQIVPLGSQVAGSKDGTFGGTVSSQVQALVSLVTSRMYDRNYNPLPANFVTNVLVFQTPGVPITCDVTGSYTPYSCIDGNLVEPGGQNLPDATAFMETEFNPANQSEKQFSMPPYHFLMMPYDITPIVAGQQGASVFGNVGTVGTVQTLADPLYEVLPERFTGIPWSATIKQNLALYQKFWSAAPSPALVAIKKSGQSASLTAAAQPSQETVILNKLLNTVESIVQSNVFSPTSYTITQVHDQWKGNLVKQLIGSNGAWVQEWEMGPYDIAKSTTTLPASSATSSPANIAANPTANPITTNTNWSIALLNEECALNSHYIYTLTANQTTAVNGLWVMAQLDGFQKALTESSLATVSASLANPNIYLKTINSFYLVAITPPSIAVGNTSKVLQQNMINYYNLQPRADGNYYGIAPTQVQDMGHLENLFVNIGKNFQDNTKESTSNVLIDLLSGRVLVLTQDANNQTYLLPMVNIQGYEITLDPAIILHTFAPKGLDASLNAYLAQNVTGFSGPSYTVSFGDKQLSLPREALDSGNYIYEYRSSNPIKPVDYLISVQSFTPPSATKPVHFFNLPVEQDVQMMVSLVDYEKVFPKSTSGQTLSYLPIKGVSTAEERINYKFLTTTNYFNTDLLSQAFLDGLEAANKTALNAAISNAPVVTTPAPVNQDLVDENAVINYEESQEHSGQYFDPTALNQNNLTHSDESDSIFGGNFFLYNDSNNNYFLGVGSMTGMPDSEIFDTYYAFSLEGYMGSSFPSSLANLQSPVGGYYAKNDAGKYALTQVVFGPTAQHIASTYGVYVNPKDGTQQLSIPIPVKSLFMDPASDMDLEGGQATGTFMRLIRSLPPVLEGYDYYLYENVAIPGLIASPGTMGVKMTPSAYLVQINPPQGPASYVDLMTGMAYDMTGKPLPQQAHVYKRSDQPNTKFNPLITWGQDQDCQLLVPFTNSTIVSSMVANNLAAQGQNEVFVLYGTTLANVVYVYQDPVTGKQYNYTRCSSSGAAIDGNVYQFDATTQMLIKTYNTAQVTAGDTSKIATDASKKVTLSNKNMLLALQDAAKNGYQPYSTVYTLQPLTLDVTLSSGSVAPQLPSVTATHIIGADKWTLNYNVSVTSSTSSQSTTITVNENYFPTIDSNNNQLFNTVITNAVGMYNSSTLSAGQISLTSLNGMSPSSLNLAQQIRDGFVINAFNSKTNAYDIVSAVIASGTIFRSTSSSGSFTNSDIAATVSCKVASGQPFMPAFVDSAFSKNVSVYQISPSVNPTGSSFNTSFFGAGNTFVYAPQYVSNPQADFTEYFMAWGLEPEISTEGTISIVNYLEVDDLAPITADKVFVDLNATLGESTTSASAVVPIEEYLKARYGKMVESLNKIQQDLAAAAKAITKGTKAITSAAPIPTSNPYVTTSLSSTTKKQVLQSAQQQITSLRQAAIENKQIQQQMHTQFGGTVWGPIFSAMPPQQLAATAKLYYDARSGYIVYKIGDYDQGADFYDITGITEGYILMPMIFADKSQGAQPLAGLPSTYRLSGIVFDTDGQTIHEVVSMKDLNAIQKSIGNLGTLQADRQSAQKIIFDVKIQLPQVQDATFVAATPAPSTRVVTSPAPQPTVVDSSGD